MADLGQNMLKLKFSSAADGSKNEIKSAFEETGPSLMDLAANLVAPGAAPIAETPVPSASPNQTPDMKVVNDALATKAPVMVEDKPFTPETDARTIERSIDRTENTVQKAQQELAKVAGPEGGNGTAAPGGMMRAAAASGIGLAVGVVTDALSPIPLPGVTTLLAAAPMVQEIALKGAGTYGVQTASAPVSGKGDPGYGRSSSSATASDGFNAMLSNVPGAGSGVYERAAIVGDALKDGETKFSPKAMERLADSISTLSQRTEDAKNRFLDRGQGFQVHNAEAVQVVADRDFSHGSKAVEVNQTRPSITIFDNRA